MQKHNCAESFSSQTGLCSLNYKLYQASLNTVSLLDMAERTRGRKYISFCRWAFILGSFWLPWALPILILADKFWTVLLLLSLHSPLLKQGIVYLYSIMLCNFNHTQMSHWLEWANGIFFLLNVCGSKIHILKIWSSHGRAPFAPGDTYIDGHLLVSVLKDYVTTILSQDYTVF